MLCFSGNEPWKTGIENQGQLNICILLRFHLPTSSVTLILKASFYNTNILEHTYNFTMLSTDTVHWGGWWEHSTLLSCSIPDSDTVLYVVMTTGTQEMIRGAAASSSQTWPFPRSRSCRWPVYKSYLTSSLASVLGEICIRNKVLFTFAKSHFFIVRYKFT